LALGAFLDLDYLVGHQPVRLAVDGRCGAEAKLSADRYPGAKPAGQTFRTTIR
jgi:hypothetical protein